VYVNDATVIEASLSLDDVGTVILADVVRYTGRRSPSNVVYLTKGHDATSVFLVHPVFDNEDDLFILEELIQHVPLPT